MAFQQYAGGNFIDFDDVVSPLPRQLVTMPALPSGGFFYVVELLIRLCFLQAGSYPVSITGGFVDLTTMTTLLPLEYTALVLTVEDEILHFANLQFRQLDATHNYGLSIFSIVPVLGAPAVATYSGRVLLVHSTYWSDVQQ